MRRASVDRWDSRNQNDGVSLHAHDVVVVLKAHLWAEGDAWSFERLGRSVGVSASQAHASLRRLAEAGLYRESDRSLRVHAFTAFAEHGIPYVFPARVGSAAVGMPTAHAAPPLRDELAFDVAYVWPGADGEPGLAVAPLHPEVPAAAAADDRLYAALALIDAFRVGRVRERKLAGPALERLLNERARDTSWAGARELARGAG